MPVSNSSSSFLTSTVAPSLPRHQPRSSLTSLYDLLADFDDTQLEYLIQEMNSTTVQNIAVKQAISAIETENPSYFLSSARANMQVPTMQRQVSMTRSQRVRLSLQTMFRAPSVRHQQQPQPREVHINNSTDDDVLSTPTGRRKSPAYKRISRPHFDLPPGITIADLLSMLEAEFLTAPLSPSCMSNASSSFSSSPSPTTSASSGRIRRYPSTIDMALEAERSASGVEGIGLGMFEPRPLTPATPRSFQMQNIPMPVTPTPISPLVLSSTSISTPDCRLRGDTPPPPPVVLEGIFEVLEPRKDYH